MTKQFNIVIPAKAGIQRFAAAKQKDPVTAQTRLLDPVSAPRASARARDDGKVRW